MTPFTPRAMAGDGPRYLSTGATAVAVVLIAAAASVLLRTGSADAAAGRKPNPAPPSTAVATTTSSPTTSPTSVTSPTSASSAATTSSTATATPSPTIATVPPCTEVPFDGEAWCVSTIRDVIAGTWGTGQRVVVEGSVDAVIGANVTLVSWSCPPAMFCGTSVDVLEVDFAGLTVVPAVGATVDVYGITGEARTLSPVGFTDLSMHQ